MQDKIIKSAYARCLQLAHDHYENFPTASRIVSKTHRDATAAIYSFARRADDIADEGSKPDHQRIKELDEFSEMLAMIAAGLQPDDDTFIALQDTISRYQLPLLPFEKLLTAFKMDVSKKRFANFDEILFYCEHSANPVGELILRIHGYHNPVTAALSDKICTALQLINFIQDIHDDMKIRDRIYIPVEEMEKFAITEEQIKSGENSENLRELVNDQLLRAVSMLVSGAGLIDHLQGRLKWIIKVTIISALLISEKLSRRDDVFSRPVLSRMDWLKIIRRSIYFRPDETHAKIVLNATHRTSIG
jgi:squalene synthase HpnC